MKIVFINSVCGTGSTGRICVDLAKKYESEGHTVKIAYGRNKHVPSSCERFAVRIGSQPSVYTHVLKARLFDASGFGSIHATQKFLKWLDAFQPDLVWLHNIHGYYINIELLFDWLKKHPTIQIKWTLHDCWSFTGHCSYFTYVKCDKWKNGCLTCPQIKSYPASLGYDGSKRNYQKKKNLFTGLAKMTLITPSQWLADLVKQSFLKDYPVKVVYNTIDTTVFKPTASDFRERFHIGDKKMILGVASIWSPRKGFQDFMKLSKIIDQNTVIVLVGLDKKQMKELPKNIIGISRTNNTKELAEIYTAADVFFNPTYEDNYPTVNLEAEACGTPVITYDTGGCEETIHNLRGHIIPVGAFRSCNTFLNYYYSAQYHNPKL